MIPSKKAEEMTRAELAAYIDQSVLKPEFTREDIVKYIKEGIDFGCKTVCVNPASADLARELCKDTNTGICVVCDFPFGLSTKEGKIILAEEILRRGKVDDLDIVSNYGFIRSGMYKEVGDEIKAVADVVHKHGAILKVIFETDALNLEQIAKATEVACEAGADYVKTSTGFYTGGESKGATVEVVKTMIDAAKGRCKVKGSGAIRDKKHFFELINLGIDRMGIGYKSTPVVLG